MDGVTVIEHPLVRHKLTIMRKKETSTMRLPPPAQGNLDAALL